MAVDQTRKGRTLVTGATGALGPSVVHALRSDGRAVRTLTRHAPPPGLLAHDVCGQVGCITDRDAVDAAMEGCDTVVHLAALLHQVNPAPDLQSEYDRVNAQGTANLLRAAKKARVARFVFLSTIAVYGKNQIAGRILDEDTKPHPNTAYGSSKLKAEQHVLNARRDDGAPMGVVLRSGAIYGPRVKGNYRRLVRALNSGRLVVVGSGNNRRTLVYDKDVSSAILLALSHPLAAGRLYNLSDGEFHTLRQIVTVIGHALGKQPRVWHVPAPLARGGATVVDTVGGLVYRSTSFRAAVDKITEDIAVDSQRIRRELGFTPRYDLAAGWVETVATMRSQHETTP